VTRFDHSSHKPFFDYYAEASQSETAFKRFAAIRDTVLRVIRKSGREEGPLDVADIGCGAGTQCIIWAKAGHRVHGLDVNEPLLTLGRERAEATGHCIDFRLGSATKLPWADGSMDVCLVLELLEHVAEWEACLDEFSRVLRPHGVLMLTTTNWLCPVQDEFQLPLYSWYPGPIKRHFERLAETTHPHLANFAKYPAVNWFSFYSLRRVLASKGFRSFDQFDVKDLSSARPLVKWAARLIRWNPVIRLLAHVATNGSIVIAIKAQRDER
jgi:2-polyprenyl-3-methyl-5-hydroxy-6-metoxy-1,4-benzoquinol methylase